MPWIENVLAHHIHRFSSSLGHVDHTRTFYPKVVEEGELWGDRSDRLTVASLSIVTKLEPFLVASVIRSRDILVFTKETIFLGQE